MSRAQVSVCSQRIQRILMSEKEQDMFWLCRLEVHQTGKCDTSQKKRVTDNCNLRETQWVASLEI